eukprot:COSAG04_NODE_7186_length_1171_cov_28.338583_2_plen_327_part_01
MTIGRGLSERGARLVDGGTEEQTIWRGFCAAVAGSTITELIVEEIGMGPQAAATLADALESSRSLTALSVLGNKVGQGVKSLIRAFEGNSCIQTILGISGDTVDLADLGWADIGMLVAELRAKRTRALSLRAIVVSDEIRVPVHGRLPESEQGRLTVPALDQELARVLAGALPTIENLTELKIDGFSSGPFSYEYTRTTVGSLRDPGGLLDAAIDESPLLRSITLCASGGKFFQHPYGLSWVDRQNCIMNGALGATFSHLVCLDVSNSHICLCDAVILACGIHAHAKLETLKLSDNDLFIVECRVSDDEDEEAKDETEQEEQEEQTA